MMKREVRVYNMIIPLWLLWLFPPLFPWVLPVILLGNLAIDTAVLSLALKAMRRTDREQLMEHLWWRIWWRGFAADAAGMAWLFLALILWEMSFGHRPTFWQKWLGFVMGDPFGHPVALLWTLTAVAIAGVCIYRLDRKALRSAGLTGREAHRAALALAIITAPWTFLIPTPM